MTAAAMAAVAATAQPVGSAPGTHVYSSTGGGPPLHLFAALDRKGAQRRRARQTHPHKRRGRLG